MLGLSSGWLTNTGSCICKEVSISAWTCGGADAVRAIKGAFDKARNPPSLEKDFRNPLPLRQISTNIRVMCEICYIHVPTNQICSVLHQQQSLQGAFEKMDSQIFPSTEGSLHAPETWKLSHKVDHTASVAILNTLNTIPSKSTIPKRNFPATASSNFSPAVTLKADTLISWNCWT